MATVTPNSPNLKRFMKAAADLHKSGELKKRADALWDRAKRGLGVNGCGICYTGSEPAADSPWVSIEMPLAEYLAQWPDVTPAQRTWEVQGTTRPH